MSDSEAPLRVYGASVSYYRIPLPGFVKRALIRRR